ncbi:hypothetical protein [Nocardioides sp. Root190]|uniref:hypothetical protein n=1 Tax=Nocardioides sp. Root190 TaxID=1736488 RepID=UPI0012FA4600|nr:hypothetical protein [Nocardioides sp. Root190]
MDEVLTDAIAPVLRDLESAGIESPQIKAGSWVDEPDIASATLLSPDGGRTGVSFSRLLSTVERVASTADQVQAWVIEEQWTGGSTNWPPCPRHPRNHPMTVSIQGAVAAWTCPKDNVVVAPVGEL